MFLVILALLTLLFMKYGKRLIIYIPSGGIAYSFNTSLDFTKTHRISMKQGHAG